MKVKSILLKDTDDFEYNTLFIIDDQEYLKIIKTLQVIEQNHESNDYSEPLYSKCFAYLNDNCLARYTGVTENFNNTFNYIIGG